MIIGVVGHTSRQEMARRLQAEVNADYCNIDDGSLGCEGNHLHVLRELVKIRGTRRHCWYLVLEEDAVPVPDFRSHARRALNFAPAQVVGMYLGTSNPSGETARQVRQAVMAAQAWIVGDCLIGSVAYAMRSEIAGDLIADISRREREIGMRISHWAQDRGVDICYTNPSLVDHDDSDSVQCPWRSPHYQARKAWNFGIRNHWDTPTVRLGYCPAWSKT